jgi:hypothetical protein
MLKDRSISTLLQQRKFVLGMFFSILIAVGVFVHRDYGMGVDEPIERANGMISLNYIADQFGISKLQNSDLLKTYRFATLDTYKDRDYPVLFNLPAAFLEWAFNINDEQTVYWYRHLLNYLVCLAGVYAIFRIAERRFESWKVGIVTAALFILSPRFFAEMFYNSKDLIFLTFFAIATNSLIAFLLKPTHRLAIWHGVAFALAMNVRIMGVILVLVTISILCVQALKGSLIKKSFLGLLATFLVSTFIFTYLFWPWLWSNPIANLQQGFANMAHFRLTMAIPYLGQSILSTQVPWHFILVYIVVTTPIAYLFLFFIGVAVTLQKLWEAKWQIWANDLQLQDLIFLGLFCAPILAVITMHSVLYNGWRQMYFIYPAFLLLVMRGLIFLWDAFSNKLLVQKLSRGLITLVLGASMLLTAGWMIQVHPFQNLYFNILAGNNWNKDFEADYWALSHQRALKWILESDDRSVIRVTGVWQDILPKVERSRIAKVDLVADADYVVDGAGPALFPAHQDREDGHTFVHQISIDKKGFSPISKRNEVVNPFRELKLNELIEFKAGGNGSSYLLAVGRQNQIGWGWGFPENWGTWSDGPQAKLLLPVPNNKPSQLVLNVRPFVSAVHPSQNLKIWINQQLAGTYQLSAPDSQVNIHLTEKMRERNYLEVLFQFDTYSSPKQLGLGEDERRLAIGLVSAQFK